MSELPFSMPKVNVAGGELHLCLVTRNWPELDAQPQKREGGVTCCGSVSRAHPTPGVFLKR